MDLSMENACSRGRMKVPELLRSVLPRYKRLIGSENVPEYQFKACCSLRIVYEIRTQTS